MRTATADLPHPRVFWHIWSQPLITIGRGSYMNELLEIAGAENVYADLELVSPPVSLEDVVRRDPDVVLAGPSNAKILTSEPRWQAIGAVREGRIAVVDTTLVGRPSVLLGKAAVHLAQVLDPFRDFRPAGNGKREAGNATAGNGKRESSRSRDRESGMGRQLAAND